MDSLYMKLVIGMVFTLILSTGQQPVHAQQQLTPLTAELLNRSVNKLPFVIALERGLYKKYGLDVKLWMPDPSYIAQWGTGEEEFEGGIKVDMERPEDPDLSIDGITPMMVRITTNAPDYGRHRIAIASTDCVVRWHIFARDGITRLEELKHKRLGISGPGAMTDFVGRLLAQKMGWAIGQDISLISNGTSVQALRNGWVDAYVAYEVPYAYAIEAGLTPIADLRDWNESIGGSSVRVKREWLKNPANRDAAIRFLKATIEAISLFQSDNGAVAFEVMNKWNGISDREFASFVYEGGKEMPRKPYPCVDGISKTMELFDSYEMRKYKVEDFYDDSLMRELDESGFIDSFY